MGEGETQGQSFGTRRDRCPFCRDEIVPGDARLACNDCTAWHHQACWREGGSKCSSCGNSSTGLEKGVSFWGLGGRRAPAPAGPKSLTAREARGRLIAGILLIPVGVFVGADLGLDREILGGLLVLVLFAGIGVALIASSWTLRR